MGRKQPITKKAKISSTTHVHFYNDYMVNNNNIIQKKYCFCSQSSNWEYFHNLMFKQFVINKICIFSKFLQFFCYHRAIELVNQCIEPLSMENLCLKGSEIEATCQMLSYRGLTEDNALFHRHQAFM